MSFLLILYILIGCFIAGFVSAAIYYHFHDNPEAGRRR